MKSPSLSFWEKSVLLEKTDLVVIGSGIVGINAALSYRQKYPKASITIIERGTFPIGASTRNAGFACFGSVSEILADLEKHNEQEVISLLQKRWQGLERLKSLLGEKNIDFQQTGSYEYFDKNEEAVFQKCRDKLSYVNKLTSYAIGAEEVFKITDTKIVNTGLNVSHLIENVEEGMLNTGKMMQSFLRLARRHDIQFFNGLTVESIDYSADNVSIVLDSGWEVKSEKCIVATNGFTKVLLPELEVKPARNLVLITQPVKNLKFNACFHGDEGYYYFRSVGDRILLGGGRNLALDVETTNQFGENPMIKTALVNKLKTLILPDQEVEIAQWWSGILGVGEKKYPIVKKIDDRVVAVARLGGMGVAIGSLLGKEAVDTLEA